MKVSDAMGGGYAPKGKTSVVRANPTYESLGMISAISNRGKVNWMIVDRSNKAGRFIEFLTRQIRDAANKVFLVLDNLRVHYAAKDVRQWLSDHFGEIELFILTAIQP